MRYDLSAARGALAVTLLALLGGCGGSGAPAGNAGAAANQTQPAPSPTPSPTPAIARAPEDEQLAAGFRAVFGKPSPIDDAKTGETITAAKLVWQHDRAVLITTTEIADGCHACSGSLGVYYLAPEGDGFRVTGRFPQAVTGNGFGGAPSEWRVTEKFEAVPVIYSESGWSGQGYTCSNFTLTELGADKPVEIASVPIYYDDRDTGADDAKGVVEGKMGRIEPGQSFTVNYSGALSFSETWQRKGAKYRLAGKSRMLTC